MTRRRALWAPAAAVAIAAALPGTIAPAERAAPPGIAVRAGTVAPGPEPGALPQDRIVFLDAYDHAGRSRPALPATTTTTSLPSRPPRPPVRPPAPPARPRPVPTTTTALPAQEPPPPAADGTPRHLGQEQAAALGWAGAEWACLDGLWTEESGWNPLLYNRGGSGAYGIPQALPAGKMASAGPDWRTNPATQIRWGLGYIAGRYGTPCAALQHKHARGSY